MPSGCFLGPSWATLGPVLGGSRRVWWPSWGVYLFFQSVLGASWGRPGTILDPLGRSPDPPGDLLDASWRLFAAPSATSGASRCDLTRKSKIKPSLQRELDFRWPRGSKFHQKIVEKTALGRLGASWRVLGASGERLCTISGRLGIVLGRLEIVLGIFGAVLQPPEGHVYLWQLREGCSLGGGPPRAY